MAWPYEATPAPNEMKHPSPGHDPTVPSHDRRLLMIVSLLTILLMSLHIADDIVRGISPAASHNVGAVVIFLVWLIGTLLLADRRLGYALQLLGGIFAAAMPILHFTGARYPAVAASSWGFFFVWSLIAVGTTGAFAAILSARALWLTVKPRA